MGILSTLLGVKDGHGPKRDAVIRTATASEVEPAIRLILGGGSAALSEQHVQDFIAYARSRQIDLGGVWVAEQDGNIVQALLPIVSPGRTMLVLAAPRVSAGAAEHLLKRLIEAACRQGIVKDLQLAQALIDPAEDALVRAYRSSGFELMAELIYLLTEVRGGMSPPTLAAGDSWETYSPQTHSLFAQAIQATYHNSLDCPALNGMRDIEDVIEGHKAAGDFDPALWFLLRRGQSTLGVLLLSVSGRNDMLELVYLGLAAPARGQKLGELLMRQALAMANQRKRPRLTLAVDAKNVPALKLYYRHGMARMTAKYALMCDLRRK